METSLVDRVLAHISAPFLAHPLWVGIWRDYRVVDGMQIAHRRDLFPADGEGEPVGPRALDQIVEDVRFNTSLPPALFEKPVLAGCP